MKKIKILDNTNLIFDIFNKITSNSREITFTQDELEILELKNNLPNILVFTNKLKNITLNKLSYSILINSNRYNLETSNIIVQNSKHAIAGLKCGNKYYIYDSNNIISTDDWPSGSIVNYNEKKKTTYNTDLYYSDITQFDYAIYIKE